MMTASKRTNAMTPLLCCAAVLFIVAFHFHVVTAASSSSSSTVLPEKVFWDNDWPSDLTLPGDYNVESSSNTEGSLSLAAADLLWTLTAPHEVKGQHALNRVGNDPTSEGFLELFEAQVNNEVRVRTWNGSWIGNLYLPDPLILKLGSKFQLICGSSWGVWVRYSNDGGTTNEAKRVNYNERLTLAVLDDGDGQPTWYAQDEYVPPPTEVPSESPTAAPTTLEEKRYDLLEGTVLFGQSHVIPSKNRIVGDNQPHLTAMRKTLVMMKPHKNLNEFGGENSTNTVVMTVLDGDGNILESDMVMDDPSKIPKHAGWIELGNNLNADELEIPEELEGDRYVVQHKRNLDKIGGNDESKVGAVEELLNSEDVASNNNQVEIKTRDGSWIRRVYLPDGSKVPSNTMVQITCGSSWAVELRYPDNNTEGQKKSGGSSSYSSQTVRNGQKLVAVLVNDGKTWVTLSDLVHNDYIFGHNFYTSILKEEWVQPGVSLEFRLLLNNENNNSNNNGGREVIGVLDDIEVGGVTELTITTLDVGLLTEPRDQFKFQDDPALHREYFETTLASRLIVAPYESMHLEEIVLPDGTFYGTGQISNTNGGWHTGDMRQHIAKVLLSHGIDMANYGIFSSRGNSEKDHPFTCALLAAHNAVGMYQNGRRVHGGSGGNGMITLDSTIGNEFSHEVGHNYGLGHYVDGFDGSVHRPSNETNSAWGWNSQTNTFVPNFESTNTGKDQCVNGKCQSAFDEKYRYGKDSMAGGYPMWQSSNHYTHYTPNSAVRIQNFLERKAVFDPTSSTGFRKWDPSTQRMEEFKNIIQKNDGEEEKVPKLYRVPVTTIVGYYDPDPNRGLKPYVYPAMHGSHGFVYDADGDTFPLTSDDNDVNDSCELVVETNNSGVQVFKLSTTIHNAMNKFHVNVATVDEPYEAKVYCRNELQAQRALELPREPLKYTVTGVPFDDDSNNNEDINTIQMFKVDVPSPSNAPSAAPSSIPSEMPTTSMEPTSYPTSFPTTTNPPTTISEEEEENACKDSVESFQWNQKKHANCAWLRTVSSGVLNKQCNKKKQDRRVFDWCPVTCGKCLPPSAE